MSVIYDCKSPVVARTLNLWPDILKSFYRPTQTTRVPAKKENWENCLAVVLLMLKWERRKNYRQDCFPSRSRIYVVIGASPERIHLTLMENRSDTSGSLMPFKMCRYPYGSVSKLFCESPSEIQKENLLGKSALYLY